MRRLARPGRGPHGGGTASAPKTLLTVLALVLAGPVLVSACGKRDLGYFRINERLEAGRVEVPGTTEVTATCRAGEQLVGGGYSLSPATPLGSATDGSEINPLVVLASVPSDPPESWTVRVFNPDEESDGPNAGSLVLAEAYCVVADHFPLRMERVRSDAVSPSFSGSTDLAVSCPDGSTLTAGGFETTPTVPWAGLHNAWFLRSVPMTGQDGVADGWRLTHHVIDWRGTLPDVPGPESRVHALCARQNLSGAEAVSGPLDTNPGANYWHHEGEVLCPRDQFAVGGGYGFTGDPLIPHHVFRAQGTGDFGGWEQGTIYGHETGAPGEVTGWAACIRAPELAFVVHITEPADGATIGPSSDGGGETDPVTFSAVAVDETGNVLGGVSFEWTDNGAPLGTGSTVSAPLTAQTCAEGEGFIDHEITVTGTNADGDTSTDSITVLAGEIC